LPPECEPGRYGEGCKKKCSCPPDARCDHITGRCWKECPQGYHGENCDQGEVVGLEVASRDPPLGSLREGGRILMHRDPYSGKEGKLSLHPAPWASLLL